MLKCKLPECGKVFDPTKPWQAFCCTDHKDLWWRKVRRGWVPPEEQKEEPREPMKRRAWG